jgi:hypothetical protein
MPEPFNAEDGSGAVRHAVTPEPSLAEWRAQCYRAHGDVRALRTGSGSGGTGHVVTLERLPGGWRTQCHEAHDDVGALRHLEWV